MASAPEHRSAASAGEHAPAPAPWRGAVYMIDAAPSMLYHASP
eukprot:CAMPEP_0185346282 /NCGR_PEP_ID=MMETSP1364-20130426/360_1 /TAXON_ID=38817 /ORGANISM="Gephyrocapsa oceanica, Strain RCC1303" /LENGTH=42 /DNA_ID= /DNA_START= /DNA_END= /DNA_ORIENTATION=